MATDRPRIQVYIDPELYESYKGWKQERGIEKDSAAFNELLREFFGVSAQSSSNEPDKGVDELRFLIQEELWGAGKKDFIEGIRAEAEAMIAQKVSEAESFWQASGEAFREKLHRQQALIEGIESQLREHRVQFGIIEEFGNILKAKLNQLELAFAMHSLSEMSGKLLDELPSESPEETRSPQELPGLIEESSQAESSEQAIDQGELPNEPPSKLPDKLTQTELAQRLNCHKSQVSRRSKQSDFEEWTRERDPDAIAWKYDPTSKQYLALGYLEG